MYRSLFLLCVLFAAAGCGLLERGPAAPGPLPGVPALDNSTLDDPALDNPAPDHPLALGEGRTAEALDQTTPEERAEALAAPAATSERELGRVSVSLGSPVEPGLWLRSTLVSVAGEGRVVTANGASIAVDLLPGQSGAQLSLAAFRALGLSLTALPEVTIYAR